MREAAPDMPAWNSARSAISASGTSAMSLSAASSAKFSAALTTVLLQQAQHLVEELGRHHAAADHRVRRLGERAPFGLQLRRDRLHHEAALSHRVDRFALLPPAERPQLCTDSLAGTSRSRPVARSHWPTVLSRLAVSTRTVDYHLRNVFAALGVGLGAAVNFR